MSNLLREYIKSILLTQQLYEAKPAKGPASAPDRTQLWLLANKQLGYAAEWALWQACGGGGSFMEDSRLSNIYENAMDTEKLIFDDIYAQMVDVATNSLGEFGKKITVENSDLSNPPNSPDAKGGSTAKVDVPTDTIDFHVKYNDDKRLSGFQREKSEIDPSTKEKIVLSPSSATAAIYFAALDEHIKKIIGNKKNLTLLPIFKKRLYNEKGKALPKHEQPKDTQQSWVDTNGILRKGAYGSKYAGTDMEKDFDAAKKAYQDVVARGDQRLALQAIFTKKRLPQAIVNDIYKEFSPSGGGKTTIFAKFNTSPKNLSKLSLNKGKISTADNKLINAYKESMSLSLIDYHDKKNPLIPIKANAKAVLSYVDPNAEEVLNAKATAELKGKKAVESKPTTLFYNVVNKSDETKIYFQIEFRLDGEGHPPQLKVGPALSTAK